MKIEINSLYWNNGEELCKLHKEVMNHFKIPVNYYNCDNCPHGAWINSILENSNSDIVGIIENDCIPIKKEIIDECINYVKNSGTFIGMAQCSNHIHPFNHIYAAPCFYFISKDFWINTGKISFSENNRSDVGEELCRYCDERKITYKAIYPTFFEKPADEGVWKLTNYGYYGIGTLFGDSIYHLYQGRKKQNIELFKKRCQQVIKGKFNKKGFLSSTEFYNGKVF